MFLSLQACLLGLLYNFRPDGAIMSVCMSLPVCLHNIFGCRTQSLRRTDGAAFVQLSQVTRHNKGPFLCLIVLKQVLQPKLPKRYREPGSAGLQSSNALETASFQGALGCCLSQVTPCTLLGC